MNTVSKLGSSPVLRDMSKKLVLFHRDFRAFTGGHLKVWDYFNHVASAGGYEPRVAFSGESRWDSTNPWFESRDYVTSWAPEKADILFVAGTDWRAVPGLRRGNFPHPILNLIQHQRHGEAGSELHSFLKNHAIRICVSDAVANAIKATGEVNGPIYVNPNGIDLNSMPKGKSFERRSTDVLICGLKAPELAREVNAAMAGGKRAVTCLTNWIPRGEYLTRLSDAKVTVVLPRPTEGFYLPALEAMGCGTIVVCPDCHGNRDFCQDGVNCFRPGYDPDEIVAALFEALQQPESERTMMQQHAEATALTHSLETERANFLGILARAEELW